jgi:hypothetical protein
LKIRPLYGLKTQGNKHALSRCNIPEEKSSTALLRKPQNLQEEIPFFCFYSEQKCATHLILVVYVE